MRSRFLTEQDLERFTRNDARVRGGVVGHARKSLTAPVLRHGPSTSTGVDPIDRARIGEAGENPAPSPSAEKPLYRSKWDAAYAAKLELEKQAGLVKAWWYEPLSLWLPGKVRYKPDFLIQYPEGLERRCEIIEVKGWSKNRRDGITRLKIAAALFPCFTWRMVYKVKGGGWEEQSL